MTEEEKQAVANRLVTTRRGRNIEDEGAGAMSLKRSIESLLAERPVEDMSLKPIRITDKLPEVGVWVLGFGLIGDGATWITVRRKSEDAWEDSAYRDCEGFVTHWLPMPDPPR